MKKGAIGKAMLGGGVVLIALNTLGSVPPLFLYDSETIASSPGYFAGYFSALLGIYVAGGLLVWKGNKWSKIKQDKTQKSVGSRE
ncbi:MAG: hypothetical protein HRF40_12230 [Nitrososphaera sp.]|jgi:hypothetical protein